jgi:alkaline phosphatase isozyme conversion protein
MSSGLRTRGGLLAVAVAAALVVAIGLAAAGVFSGSPSPTYTGRPSAAVSSTRHGDVAWATARTLARSVRARHANTWGEIKAREFVFSAFQQYGLLPRTQEFIVGSGSRAIHSANIIAVKQGDSARQLVVGAHYDSAGPGEGYIDNATGVGLLLEIAARVTQRPTPYTIVFVAFGDEENGCGGSRYYIEAMTGLERRATLGMIDLQSVAGGPGLVALSRAGSPAWLRDDALAAAQGLHITVDEGVATAASDDRSFAANGTPTVMLSSFHWKRPDAASAGANEDDAARLVHTARDTTAYVSETYPGRVRLQLRSFSRLLETLLTAKLEKHQ